MLSNDGASDVVKNVTRTVTEASATVKGLTGIDIPELLNQALGGRATTSRRAVAAARPSRRPRRAAAGRGAGSGGGRSAVGSGGRSGSGAAVGASARDRGRPRRASGAARRRPRPSAPATAASRRHRGSTRRRPSTRPWPMPIVRCERPPRPRRPRPAPTRPPARHAAPAACPAPARGHHPRDDRRRRGPQAGGGPARGPGIERFADVQLAQLENAGARGRCARCGGSPRSRSASRSAQLTIGEVIDRYGSTPPAGLRPRPRAWTRTGELRWRGRAIQIADDR